MGDAVRVEDRGAVRVLTLDRPRRRNALDLDDRRDVVAAIGEAERAPGCRAVVLTGAGGVFSAGGDIRSMSQDPEVAALRLDVVNELARAVATSPLPLVAAVEGGAFGLGLALAAACDFVVAARDARFVASFARLGLTADTGLAWSLAQRVGPGRAKELILLADEVPAPEAHRIGLVSALAEPGEALERAMAVAGRLAAAAPGAVAGTKRIFAATAGGLEEVLAEEKRVQVGLLAGDDFAEGRDAFLVGRPPRFGPRA